MQFISFIPFAVEAGGLDLEDEFGGQSDVEGKYVFHLYSVQLRYICMQIL